MSTSPETAHEVRLAAAHPAGDSDLTWTPAWRIRQMIANRQVSAVEVARHFLDRAEALEPRFHAFREIDRRDVLSQAQQAQDKVRRGDPLGPLHGVPVAAKQVLSIKGSKYSGMGGGKVPAERDSMEIERLRAAGAVVLGPTVAGLVAMEFGDSDRMPLNPWDTGRVCGDSSGGSACALSAGMTTLSIGGDGYGSTRLPAAFCGLIGLHPTRGRVPSFEWTTLNTRPFTTYGPMARDVRDAATALSVLAGPDGRDVMCLQDDPPDYLARMQDGAAGLRLAWTDDFGHARRHAVAETERVIETVRRAAWRLQDAGARIETIDRVFEDPIWAGNQWVATDVAQTTDYDLGLKLPTREEIVRARETRQRVWQAMRGVTDQADFIICPTVLEIAPTRQAWAQDGIRLDFSGIYVAMTAVANILGWPAMSVPAGLVDGMPVSLQIIGRPNSEPGMFRLAQAFLAAQE